MKKQLQPQEQALARDLSQGDERKAALVLRSPLFKVAQEGAGKLGRYLSRDWKA